MNPVQIFLAILFCVYGLCIGSFLNVCIWRIPQQLTVVNDRSFCPSCHHKLSAMDLVPLFSWLCLRGRCRYCQTPISKRYPLIESITGILFLLCFLTFGLSAKTVILCLFACALVVGAGIDFDHTYIPDRISIFIVFLAGALHCAGQAPSITSSIIGSLGVAGFMFFLSLLSGGGIGGGDIKLFAAAGLLLGLPGNIFAFFLGYILAALHILPGLLSKKTKKGTEIPMVPYFAVSMMIAALWGDSIINWYLLLFIH